MSQSIWRYRLNIDALETVLEIPAGGIVMSTEVARGGDYAIDLWVAVDTERESSSEKFYVVGTGHEIPDVPNLHFVGTCVFDSLVWHIFYQANNVR